MLESNPLRGCTEGWQIVRMTRLFFCLMILSGVDQLVGSASADDQLGFYRMLLSTEQNALDAVRRHSANDLLTIHNDAMYYTVGEGEGRWKLGPFCGRAYVHLSIAVLGYASAIDPTRSGPLKSAAEHAGWGDKVWREYLEYIAECEKAIGVSNPPVRISHPSVLLQRLLPPLPGPK
jgi:hypothetical protein